jgi:hypothetical protein
MGAADRSAGSEGRAIVAEHYTARSFVASNVGALAAEGTPRSVRFPGMG